MDTDAEIAPRGRKPPLIAHLAIAGLLLAFLMLAFPAASHAYMVENIGDEVTRQIEMSPRGLTVSVEPGQSLSRDVTITNRTGQDFSFEFHIEDYEGSHDPSQVALFRGDEDSRWGARGWLKPELASILLKHGERLTMRVTADVPDDAEPGGHYAALISSASPSDGQNTQKNINRTLFLFRMNGAVDEIGTLDFPEVPRFALRPPVRIGLVFNNLGNVHLEPAGRIVITNFRGKAVAEIPIERGWVVLPDASRRILQEWDSGFQFGRFTATAEIVYGAEQRQFVLSRSFWVFPWQLIAAIAAVLGLAAYLIYLWQTRRKERRSSPL